MPSPLMGRYRRRAFPLQPPGRIFPQTSFLNAIARSDRDVSELGGAELSIALYARIFARFCTAQCLDALCRYRIRQFRVRPHSHRSVAITALIGAQLRIRKKSSDPE
jgi:hypothetical protein